MTPARGPSEEAARYQNGMHVLLVVLFPGGLPTRFVSFVSFVSVVSLVSVVALRYPLQQREKFLRDSSHSQTGLLSMH